MRMENSTRETLIRAESQREDFIHMPMVTATRDNGKTIYIMDKVCLLTRQARHSGVPG
jgi:hypothetical protein